MGWSSSADPRKRQFEVKRGENEALKREIMDIENKRVEEHRDLTSDVSGNQITDNQETWRKSSETMPSFDLLSFHRISS